MQTFERSWFYRRWAALSTLIWCGTLVTYLALLGKADTLREAIATGTLLLMGSVIGAYIFGAAWDDRNKDRAVASAVQPPVPDTVVVASTVVNEQRPGGEE